MRVWVGVAEHHASYEAVPASALANAVGDAWRTALVATRPTTRHMAMDCAVRGVKSKRTVKPDSEVESAALACTGRSVGVCRAVLVGQ